jgi:TonB-linked SusC/RagA family outer membrane protein
MRNTVRIVLLAMSILSMTSGLQAQTAGSMISGTVYDRQGPLAGANVVEIDEANRNIAHTVTDVNGNFSFRLVNPKNRLKITFVGSKTQIIPIKSTTFKIRMEDATSLREVVVTKKTTAGGSGLAIPERELSGATQRINAAEFQGLGITTIDEALQGRIAGLDIVYNSGNLGSGTSMRMRGAASINGSSEPLIVVDGNIWETDQSENFDFNSANDEKFAQLLNVNPEDIEEINVLKDAASTAIWGSQGANGVIEITTKRGARGNTRVTYSYRLSGTYQPEGMKMLDGDQYTMMLKEAYFNPNLSDAASNIVELNYTPTFSEYQMYNNNTDWVSAVSQIGLRQNHNVSISGGGEKANFWISGGYDNESGSVIGQNLQRFTTRVSLDYFVSDRIKIVTNFNLTYTDNHKNHNAASLLSLAYKKMPNLAIYEEDVFGRSTGEYYQVLPTASNELRDQKELMNPVALAYQAENIESTINMAPEFQIRYKLLGLENNSTQLNYEGKVVFTIFNSNSSSYLPSSLITTGWSSNNNNTANAASQKNQAVTTTHTLTFVPQFENRDHAFMMLLRGQMTSGTSNNQNNAAYGLPNIFTVSVPGTISGFSTGVNEWGSMYYTGQVHYAYKGKYIFDMTTRLDATTKFGPARRWGVFPALSLRWNISDEPFMKDLSWLSMLSVRPSWGLVGNQPNREYLFYSRYVAGPSYNGQGSIYPNNIRLKNLKWEDVEQWNIGFDYGLFDGKLYGDANLYYKVTTDLLMQNRGIPSSAGYSSLAYQNTGSMENKGWELNLQTNKLLTFGKLGIDMNVTFANNRNTIMEMEPTILRSMNGEFNRNNGSYLTRVQLNNSLGSIYGFKYEGAYQYSDYSAVEVPGVSGPNAPVVKNADGDVVFNNDGTPKPMYFCYGTTAAYEFKGGDANYKDVNNDGNINELDIVYLGSSLPKITGGFGLRLRYGNLTMNNQFNFRVGNKVVNIARMNAENMYTNNNQCMSVSWRWRVEGDKTSIPRALRNYGYNWLGSDRFVEDGSFLRLNYTNFTYNVDADFVKRFGLRSMTLNLSLNNIFILTKYTGTDPEVGYGSYGIAQDNAQTPRSKSFTAGITASF